MNRSDIKKYKKFQNTNNQKQKKMDHQTSINTAKIVQQAVVNFKENQNQNKQNKSNKNNNHNSKNDSDSDEKMDILGDEWINQVLSREDLLHNTYVGGSGKAEIQNELDDIALDLNQHAQKQDDSIDPDLYLDDNQNEDDKSENQDSNDEDNNSITSLNSSPNMDGDDNDDIMEKKSNYKQNEKEKENQKEQEKVQNKDKSHNSNDNKHRKQNLQC